MALYQDGILISGANTLPKMTLAEYNALPADQRPTYWERIDADYDDMLAEKTDIAPKESGTTASRAYAIGELVYVGGTLYRVIAAIASGATFTVGTNIEAKSVSDAMGDKVNKSGDTITGDLAVVHDGTTVLSVGNNIASGNTGASVGRIRLYGSGTTYTNFISTASNTDRTIYFPDASGTVAIAEKTNVALSNALTFTNGQRIANISQLTGKSIKRVINVYANIDCPLHFWVADSTASNYQINIKLDGGYAGHSGDISLTVIYDEA